jgi:hypothetical protein
VQRPTRFLDETLSGLEVWRWRSVSIGAGHQGGVLELRIPKPAQQKPKKIAIGDGKKAIEK